MFVKAVAEAFSRPVVKEAFSRSLVTEAFSRSTIAETLSRSSRLASQTPPTEPDLTKSFLKAVTDSERDYKSDAVSKYNKYFKGLGSPDGLLETGLKFLRGYPVNKAGEIESLNAYSSLVVSAAKHGNNFEFEKDPGAVALLKGLLEVAREQGVLNSLYSHYGMEMVERSIPKAEDIKTERDLIKSLTAVEIVLDACPKDIRQTIINGSIEYKGPLISIAMKSSPEMFKLVLDKASPETRAQLVERQIKLEDVKVGSKVNSSLYKKRNGFFSLIDAFTSYAVGLGLGLSEADRRNLWSSPYRWRKYSAQEIIALGNEVFDTVGDSDVAWRASSKNLRNCADFDVFSNANNHQKGATTVESVMASKAGPRGLS